MNPDWLWLAPAAVVVGAAGYALGLWLWPRGKGGNDAK